MSQVASEHLGESLGTDSFSVREQFTEEQWSHFMRHMVDMEAIHTFEGTETMQTLIVGRAITGLGAFT
jgi:alkylation response protein AidB-like acyl-CoA dehydrogenase